MPMCIQYIRARERERRYKFARETREQRENERNGERGRESGLERVSWYCGCQATLALKGRNTEVILTKPDDALYHCGLAQRIYT